MPLQRKGAVQAMTGRADRRARFRQVLSTPCSPRPRCGLRLCAGARPGLALRSAAAVSKLVVTAMGCFAEVFGSRMRARLLPLVATKPCP
jgi:hypothetical protein